jgi:glutamine synthetase
VAAIFDLEHANANHPQSEDPLVGARYVQETVRPAMDAVREVADRLEGIVPDELWPLPKYAEILFIK